MKPDLGYDTPRLRDLLALSADLLAHPWKELFVQDADPEGYDLTQQIVTEPFFQFQPFGESGTCQVGFLQSDHRNKFGCCGNRSGKTAVALHEDACDCLMMDPMSKQPSTRFEHPIDMWTVSDTEETAIEIVQRTLVQDVLGFETDSFMWNFVDDSAKWTDKSGFSGHVLPWSNGSRINFKYSSQGRTAFQGVPRHKIHADEVCPKPIYEECRARLIDYNGYFVNTFTPISEKGIPWVYEDLYVPRIDKDLEFHHWSMLDNPHLSEEAIKKYIQEIEEDEYEARIYGMFTPTGLKRALSNQLLRQLREGCSREYEKMELMVDERETSRMIAA